MPIKHLLDLDALPLEDINEILDQASIMREILSRENKKVPLLTGKIIHTLFYEASTRTLMSFEEAGKLLSADVINMSVRSSSVTKGESLLNTGLTTQAMGADAIIIRHQDSGAPYFLARNLTSVSVINAGDGAHSHPTQGLLDLYTAKEHFKDLTGLKMVIAGDITHSRVARSVAQGFAKLGTEIILSGPPTLLPDPIALKGWPGGISTQSDLETAIKDANIVMALRLQLERQKLNFIPSERYYIRKYQINADRMALADPNAILMHPGPLNEGVEISFDLAHGIKSTVENQVTNGVAIRMAVLRSLLNQE